MTYSPALLRVGNGLFHPVNLTKMLPLLASQQRLLLRQNHAQQWINYFANERLTRAALFKQHRLELSFLLNRLTSRWELANTIRQQVLNINECNLVHQHQRQCIRLQQEMEKNQLEGALAQKPTGLA